jgi:photosynthetic reaction center H subunit
MAHDDRTQMNRDQQGSALVHTKDMEHFDIPDGQPDPRGWSVKSADGTTIGKVEDLLVDTGEGRVRYLEVKTDGDISKKGGRDYFLLPIGSARLDDEHDDVVLNMGAEDLTAVPAYERGKLSRDYETSLRDYVRGGCDDRWRSRRRYRRRWRCRPRGELLREPGVRRRVVLLARSQSHHGRDGGVERCCRSRDVERLGRSHHRQAR